METEVGSLGALYEQKAAAYAAFGNGVVAELAQAALPPGGKVLDVGCASGGLLSLLRDRAGYAAGIELAPTAAATAAEIADLVVQAPIEDPKLPFEPGFFDLVVLADVLEHIVEPEVALERAVAWTRPGGTLLVSVPNIAHWQARLTIGAGRWPVEETGTFDSGHLRFFTLERLETLLGAAGLVQVAITPVVPALRNHVPGVQRLPAGGRERLEAAWQAIGRRWPSLFGYQLVARARRPER